jgi:acetoacetate decarboxylase
MKLDPDSFYRMPLIMGPLWRGTNPGLSYTKIEVIALQFITDPSSIPRLLPDCYNPGKESLVTVFFGYYNELDFMAGGGYSVAVFQVDASFDGEKDHLKGDYILVMFENQTWPIIAGREDLGIPKLFSDISPVKSMSSGHTRCETSYWGHLLFGFELNDLKKQNKIVRLAASKVINSRPWMAYKYIPSLDGPPDAEYPTISYNDVKIDQLWLSNKGSLYFGDASENDIGHLKNLMDNFKSLPVLKVKQCMRFSGSAILRYDRSRRLI